MSQIRFEITGDLALVIDDRNDNGRFDPTIDTVVVESCGEMEDRSFCRSGDESVFPRFQDIRQYVERVLGTRLVGVAHLGTAARYFNAIQGAETAAREGRGDEARRLISVARDAIGDSGPLADRIRDLEERMRMGRETFNRGDTGLLFNHPRRNVATLFANNRELLRRTLAALHYDEARARTTHLHVMQLRSDDARRSLLQGERLPGYLASLMPASGSRPTPLASSPPINEGLNYRIFLLLRMLDGVRGSGNRDGQTDIVSGLEINAWADGNVDLTRSFFNPHHELDALLGMARSLPAE